MRLFNNDRLRLEIRRARTPFILLIVASAMGVVAGVGILRNLNFQKPWVETYTVRAAFDDAKGVSPGKNQVRLAGVRIGVVSDVELRNGRAVLTMEIDRKHGALYRDATFRIRPVSPLDDKFVAIGRRGTPSAGEIDGDVVVPGRQTASPVDISRVLQVFNKPTRESMATLIDELGRGLPDKGADLRAALAEFEPFFTSLKRLTDVTTERSTLVRRVVTNTGTLSDELARRETQIASLVTSGNQVMGELARRDTALSGTLRELPGTIQALRSATVRLDQARSHLDPALRALVPAAGELAPALNALSDVSEIGRPTVRALERPVTRLTSLAQTLPGTTADLTRAVRTLRGQVKPVDSSVAKLPPCFEPVENFFEHTMSLTKFYDGFRTVARATAGEGLFAVGALVNEPGWRRLRPCFNTPTTTKGTP